MCRIAYSAYMLAFQWDCSAELDKLSNLSDLVYSHDEKVTPNLQEFILARIQNLKVSEYL